MTKFCCPLLKHERSNQMQKLPLNEKSNIQKSWSSPIMEKLLGDLLNSVENFACQRSRLLKKNPDIGYAHRLQPTTSLGLCFLDNGTLRISVALRIKRKFAIATLEFVERT